MGRRRGALAKKGAMLYANSGMGAFTATMACQDSTILIQSSSKSESDRLLKRQNWLKGVGLVVIGSDMFVAYFCDC